VDEVGRGPLAGPVVAACVHIPESARALALWGQVRDSKRLSPARRRALAADILRYAHCALGQASAQEIDALNIRRATFLAMARAVAALPPAPGMVALVDGNAAPPDLPIPALAVVGGDARSVSIAAASIVAKVARDAQMATLDAAHPGYGFARHAGYPTAQHRAALERLGPCPAHRRTFAPVQRALCNRG
jgi:ribonuclease HII